MSLRKHMAAPWFFKTNQQQEATGHRNLEEPTLGVKLFKGFPQGGEMGNIYRCTNLGFWAVIHGNWSSKT